MSVTRLALAIVCAVALWSLNACPFAAPQPAPVTIEAQR
jgi:hypothetical protein